MAGGRKGDVAVGPDQSHALARYEPHFHDSVEGPLESLGRVNLKRPRAAVQKENEAAQDALAPAKRIVEVPFTWSLYNRASGIGDTQLGESPHKSMLKRSQ